MDKNPTKIDALRLLRQCDLDIKTIVDVGVFTNTEEFIEVFPDVKHFLFEPIEEHFDDILKNYAGIDYELIPQGMFSSEGDYSIKMKSRFGKDVTHSQITEEGKRVWFEIGYEHETSRIMKTTTLDAA